MFCVSYFACIKFRLGVWNWKLFHLLRFSKLFFSNTTPWFGSFESSSDNVQYGESVNIHACQVSYVSYSTHEIFWLVVREAENYCLLLFLESYFLNCSDIWVISNLLIWIFLRKLWCPVPYLHVGNMLPWMRKLFYWLFFEVFCRLLPALWQPYFAFSKNYIMGNQLKSRDVPFHRFHEKFFWLVGNSKRFHSHVFKCFFLEDHYLDCGPAVQLQKPRTSRIYEKAGSSRFTGFILHTWFVFHLLLVILKHFSCLALVFWKILVFGSTDRVTQYLFCFWFALCVH